jgi:hypothetical protein
MDRRSNISCRARANFIVSGARSQSWVLPSMSVNRKVMIPVGKLSTLSRYLLPCRAIVGLDCCDPGIPPAGSGTGFCLCLIPRLAGRGRIGNRCRTRGTFRLSLRGRIRARVQARDRKHRPVPYAGRAGRIARPSTLARRRSRSDHQARSVPTNSPALAPSADDSQSTHGPLRSLSLHPPRTGSDRNDR